LALDFGKTTIGSAISDIFGNTKPLSNNSISDFEEKIFFSFFEKYKFQKVVIGEITKKELLPIFDSFLKNLKKKAKELKEKIEIIIFDEKYSTWDARFTKISGKRKKFNINAVSAEIILQNYLNFNKK